MNYQKKKKKKKYEYILRSWHPNSVNQIRSKLVQASGPFQPSCLGMPAVRPSRCNTGSTSQAGISLDCVVR